MRLIRLQIAAVRNLSSVAIDCARGLNLFVGPNGAGKTAILEAVHLLARGRSFRSSMVEPIIQRDANALLVRLNSMMNTRVVCLQALSDSGGIESICGSTKHRSDERLKLPTHAHSNDATGRS